MATCLEKSENLKLVEEAGKACELVSLGKVA